MAASVQSPADMINVSLAKIGYKLRIGSLYDGSTAARLALDVYGQTRDALLRSFLWGFAEQIIPGSLSGQPAPAPWTTSYTYPNNCIQVRDLIPASYAADANNPLPPLWTIANDIPSGQRVIWAKAGGASIVYTAQVTDPSQWDTIFVEAFAIELGKKLALPLANAESLKALMEDQKLIEPLAESVIG